MREFKVGDIVVYTKNEFWSCFNDYRKGKDIKKELFKISKIVKPNVYHIEILKCVYKKECSFIKRDERCSGFTKKVNLKLVIEHLKFKKWVKG